MAWRLTVPPPFRSFVCRIARELRPGRTRPSSASGSFQAGPPPRWRRRPETLQQKSAKITLTALTVDQSLVDRPWRSRSYPAAFKPD
jgi:hypothetical protein